MCKLLLQADFSCISATSGEEEIPHHRHSAFRQAQDELAYGQAEISCSRRLDSRLRIERPRVLSGWIAIFEVAG